MRAFWALMLSALIAACTPSLATFDRLTPKDSGWRLAARDQKFGPAPLQRLDVYAPAQAAAGAPVIVFFHGGSWASGDKGDYRFLGAAFAARGFVTVVPDYRLVPEARFPLFVEDAAAAVKWTRDHIGAYGGDADRMVLAGHSAGAYNAMMIALDGRYLSAAGLSAAKIRGVVGLAGPYDFAPFDVKAAIDAFGQWPDPAATQPIAFARADAPPVFMAHGAQDRVVRVRNMRSLEEKLKAAGARVETKVYPGIGHVMIMLAIARPFRGRAPVLDDVTVFAARVTERSRAPAH